MHITPTTVTRLDQINRVSEAIKDYDTEDRIEEAQFTEFEVGILVALRPYAALLRRHKSSERPLSSNPFPSTAIFRRDRGLPAA